MKNIHTTVGPERSQVKFFLLAMFCIFGMLTAIARPDPDEITLTNSQIQENIEGEEPERDRIVGTLGVNNNDAEERFSFALVEGIGDTHNDFFRIVHRNGRKELRIRDNAHINYEVPGNRLSVRVSASGNGIVPFSKSLRIEIVDRDDPPTRMTISNDRIQETEEVRSFLARLFTYDEDLDASYTYHLIHYNEFPDNSNFIIEDNELFVRGPIDFEEDQKIHDILIEARATGRSIETFPQEFTIYIQNRNEQPTDITLSSGQIGENNSPNAFIGRLSTIDPDVDFSHEYELTDLRADNAFFTIDDNILRARGSFDYERDSSYVVSIRSTDSGELSTVENFEIKVINDPNDNFSPTAINFSLRVLVENNEINTFAGIFSTEDADQNDVHTYSLNNHQELFFISEDSLWTSASFDREEKHIYGLSVTVQDQFGGNFSDTTYISIINQNEAPTGLDLSTNIIFENNQRFDPIGQLSTEDQDDEEHTYTLTNNPGNRFRIEGDTSLVANTSFNYEAQRRYPITIQTSDGSLSYEKDFVINIEDTNDAPTSIGLLNASISEGNGLGELVGEFYSTDEDQDDNHSYKLVSDPDHGFKISGNTLIAAKVFDFEEQGTYNITVRSDDGNGGTTDSDLTITIRAENDRVGPTLTSFSPVSETRGVHPGEDVFVATFNEPITYGKGLIEVFEVDGKRIIKAYVKHNETFFIEGSQLFISFEHYAGNFAPSQKYYITISPSAIFDLSENALVNPILENDFSWTFATESGSNGRAANASQQGSENLNTEEAADAQDLEIPTVIYPNPASESITINAPKSYAIEIMDLAGKVLLRPRSRNNIDISNLRDGTYVIRLQNDAGKEYTYRLVKKN